MHSNSSGESILSSSPFSARFIADENTPDGTIMRPGQAFRKAWILLNDGSLSWDNEDIQLINLADAIRVVQAPIVPVTAPHDKAMITVDYICPNQPGTYESKWILAYRQKTFGPMIWCSIEVRSPAKEENTCRKSINREREREDSHCSIGTVLESVMKTSTFDEIKEAFEFVDVPLPACFDLSKPFQVESKFTSNASSLRVCTLFLLFMVIHRVSVRSSQVSYCRDTLPPKDHWLKTKNSTVRLRLWNHSR